MGTASRRHSTLGLILCCFVLWLEPVAGDADLATAEVAETGALAAPTAELRVQEIRKRLAGYHTGLAGFELDALAQTIEQQSRAHGVSPSLVLGVIQIESGYYNFARSPVGALGLMQIMPPTGEALASELGIAWPGPEILFDPLVNVRLGIAYLAQLKREYGRLSTALAAYNWGPGRINQRLRQGERLPARYARDVLDAYGVHAERLAALRAGSDAGAFTSTATKASTAPIATSSSAR